MVILPDALFVEGQEFVILPLDRWQHPLKPVRLAGRRTCDSDDVYPRPERPPLLLPAGGSGMTLAICGIGAYQQMISGRGGAHHCLSPEPARLIFTEHEGHLVSRYVPQQDQATIMRLLGYQPRLVPHERTTALPVRSAAHPLRSPQTVSLRRRLQQQRLARSLRESVAGD